ncbi:gluconate 2-dehydrogenase subunit 3 family protein [Larkinella soli]|uniref:gluconate 2-dehydrogenase subunit 3 family protein n=1 Tax=Larkinella soli TaxID=1770527 RepID=UPI00286E42A4|nr:gluconate 2-dehydrogenase subunit 3 family protein [Larkinella soli]
MMNRREALARVALLMGGVLTAPTLRAFADQPAGSASLPPLPVTFRLTDAQRQIVAEVAEHIIPRTDTAGAKDAGVPAFIEMMLNDCYKAPEHESFLEGVTDLEKRGFLAQSKDQQVATLREVETQTKELMKAYQVQSVKLGDNVDAVTMSKKAKGVPYWRLMKELTLLGYFTSKEGITQNFDYQPVPGRFEPVKWKPGQKAVVY